MKLMKILLLEYSKDHIETCLWIIAIICISQFASTITGLSLCLILRITSLYFWILCTPKVMNFKKLPEIIWFLLFKCTGTNLCKLTWILINMSTYILMFCFSHRMCISFMTVTTICWDHFVVVLTLTFIQWCFFSIGNLQELFCAIFSICLTFPKIIVKSLMIFYFFQAILEWRTV